MAEELRFFLRTGLWVAGTAAVYWFVSYEVAGTVLLIVLGLSIAALLAVTIRFAPRTVDDLTAGGSAPRGVIGTVNRVIGFHERSDVPPPLEGGPDLLPPSSPWPVITAAAMVVMGLGLIFGAWLLIPGLVLLVIGGIGWLVQLDWRRPPAA